MPKNRKQRLSNFIEDKEFAQFEEQTALTDAVSDLNTILGGVEQVKMRGPKGEKGERGARGADGRLGKQGPRGPRGPVGPRGERGPEGKPGRDGRNGQDGPPGRDGVDGAKGPKGDKGDAGPRGPRGIGGGGSGILIKEDGKNIKQGAGVIDLGPGLDGTTIPNGVRITADLSEVGGNMAIGNDITGGTANRVLYEDSSNQLAESDNLQFNGSTLSVNGLILGSGSITDSSGAISFGNENLTTTGNINIDSGSSKLYLGDGQDASIYFDDSDLIINSENVTASDELQITNFDKFVFTGANGSAFLNEFGHYVTNNEGGAAQNWGLGARSSADKFSIAYGSLVSSSYVDISDDIITIDGANGRVGINDSSPSTTLDVTGTANITGATVISGAVTANSTLSVVGTASVGGDFDVGGDNGLFVDVSENKVGINTNSPQNALSVSGSAFTVFDGARGIRFGVDAGVSGNRALAIFDPSATTEAGIGSGGDYTFFAMDGNDFIFHNTRNTGGTIKFRQTTSSFDRLIIDTNGNTQIPSNSSKLLFGAGQDASVYYNGTNFILNSQEAGGSGHIVLNSPKTSTGDPTGVEGKIYWNTVDNVIKMYADGAWRTLASW